MISRLGNAVVVGHLGGRMASSTWRSKADLLVAEAVRLGSDVVEEEARQKAFVLAKQHGKPLDIYEYGFSLFSLLVRLRKRKECIKILHEIDKLTIDPDYRLSYITNVYLYRTFGTKNFIVRRVINDLRGYESVNADQYIEAVKLRSMLFALDLKGKTILAHQLLNDIIKVPIFSIWIVAGIRDRIRAGKLLFGMREALHSLKRTPEATGRGEEAKLVRADLKSTLSELAGMERELSEKNRLEKTTRPGAGL